MILANDPEAVLAQEIDRSDVGLQFECAVLQPPLPHERVEVALYVAPIHAIITQMGKRPNLRVREPVLHKRVTQLLHGGDRAYLAAIDLHFRNRAHGLPW